MITHSSRTFTAIALAVLGVSTIFSTSQAATLTLHSGNGVIGGSDSLVHYLDGPNSAEFPNPFTVGDFTAAGAGPNALIIDPNPAWITGLDGDAVSQWIGTEGNNTELYAISFTLGSVSSASMVFTFAIDNVLGSAETGVNAGLFLNGTAIPGSEAAYGGFDVQYILSFPDIAALLHPGLNTLYMNAENQGGPAGFIFRAEITSTPTPEPTTVVLLGLGTLGLLARRRRAQA